MSASDELRYDTALYHPDGKRDTESRYLSTMQGGLKFYSDMSATHDEQGFGGYIEGGEPSQLYAIAQAWSDALTTKSGEDGADRSSGPSIGRAMNDDELLEAADRFKQTLIENVPFLKTDNVEYLPGKQNRSISALFRTTNSTRRAAFFGQTARDMLESSTLPSSGPGHATGAESDRPHSLTDEAADDYHASTSLPPQVKVPVAMPGGVWRTMLITPQRTEIRQAETIMRTRPASRHAATSKRRVAATGHHERQSTYAPVDGQIEPWAATVDSTPVTRSSTDIETEDAALPVHPDTRPSALLDFHTGSAVRHVDHQVYDLDGSPVDFQFQELLLRHQSCLRYSQTERDAGRLSHATVHNCPPSRIPIVVRARNRVLESQQHRRTMPNDDAKAGEAADSRISESIKEMESLFGKVTVTRTGWRSSVGNCYRLPHPADYVVLGDPLSVISRWTHGEALTNAAKTIFYLQSKGGSRAHPGSTVLTLLPGEHRMSLLVFGNDCIAHPDPRDCANCTCPTGAEMAPDTPCRLLEEIDLLSSPSKGKRPLSHPDDEATEQPAKRFMEAARAERGDPDQRPAERQVLEELDQTDSLPMGKSPLGPYGDDEAEQAVKTFMEAQPAKVEVDWFAGYTAEDPLWEE